MIKNIIFKPFFVIKLQQVGFFKKFGTNYSKESIKPFVVHDLTLIAEKKPKETKNVVQIDDSPFENIEKIHTKKYGLLKMENQLLTSKNLAPTQKFYYLNNQTSATEILEILNKDRNSLLIYTPDTYWKNIYQTFNKSLKIGIDDRKLFKNCKNNLEIFNLARKVYLEQKIKYDRVCVIVDSYSAKVQVKQLKQQDTDSFTNTPQPKLMNIFNQLVYAGPELNNQKYNILMPVQGLLALNTQDYYEKYGISIKALNRKKIFPRFKVWPPIQQNVYNLLDRYIKENKEILHGKRNVLNLGCGSGVLTFILEKYSKFMNIFGIDKSIDAVRSARLNCQFLGIQNYKFFQYELLQQMEDEYSSKLDEFSFPQEFDIILFNPPWVVASEYQIPDFMENQKYDPNGNFLKTGLNFARKRLNQFTKKSKQGRLILIYSDISEIIGLTEKNQIESLCQDNGLEISQKISIPFMEEEEDEVKSSFTEPLDSFKKEASITLYEIIRQK